MKNLQETKNLTNYIQWLKKRNLANKTIKTHLQGLRHYSFFLDKKKSNFSSSAAFTTSNISKFFQQIAKKYETNTILTRKSALNSYAQFQTKKI